MKQQTTWTLQTKGVWQVAGLSWQYLPLRGHRGMRLRAKEADATHWAELLTDDGRSQGTLLGTVALTDKTALKSGRHKLASLALTALPSLPHDCYGVIALPSGQYWFVAVSNGMLSPFGDIVGDEQSIRTAVSNFLSISPVPTDGWAVFAPSGFFPDLQTEEKSLSVLTENSTGLRRSRLRKTSNKKVLWLWAVGAMAVAGGYLLVTAWQQHQEDMRVEEAQAALLARQHQQGSAPADSLKPWAKLPRFPVMLSACSTVWKAAQISIAGWIFNTATCSADGNIALHYTLPSGGTVGDFAARLPVIYGPDIQPEFNIPGRADDASFTLTVPVSPPATPEPLLPGNLQIQHLTSYAQRINAQLRISELNANTQLSQGNVQSLPWRTFSFTFITDIPPDRLFAPTRFNSSGMRASRIMTTLKNNRLEYTIEGLLYAN